MSRENSNWYRYDCVEKSIQSVVRIFSSPNVQNEDFLGSGFLVKVNKELIIVTNSHVASTYSAYTILLFDDNRLNGVKLDRGYNQDLGALALLDIPENLVRFLDQRCLNVPETYFGVNLLDRLFTIGAPTNLPNSVTVAWVMNPRQSGKYVNPKCEADYNNDYIQYFGAIQKGNSGGPLINEQGVVVGVVARICCCSIGFAIPLDDLQKFLKQLPIENYNSKCSGRMISVQRQLEFLGVNTNNDGKIMSTLPGGDADIKKFKVGYMVTELDGKPINFNTLVFKRQSALVTVTKDNGETQTEKLTTETGVDQPIEYNNSLLPLK